MNSVVNRSRLDDVRAMTVRLLRAGLLGTGVCHGDLHEGLMCAWSPVASYARTNGLAGLILKAASQTRLPLPHGPKEYLRSAAAQVAARNLHIEAQLSRIAAGFNRAGLDVLALKGIVLSRQLYGRVDLRPMSDVDLMVRPADARRACRLLVEIGCRRAANLLRPDYFPRFCSEIQYQTGDPCPVRLDVHARPLRPMLYQRTVPDDGMWRDCRQMDIGDGWVHVPCAERMLVHLCSHAAIHGGARVLWLLDVALFANSVRATLDWDRFCEIVDDWRLGRPVRRTLERAEELFGPIFPASVRSTVSALPAGFRDRLTLWQAPRDVDHPICRVVVDILAGGSWRRRLAYLLAVAVPQQDHMATVYRPRHPAWLVCAHAWRIVRLLLRAIRRFTDSLLRTRARGSHLRWSGR